MMKNKMMRAASILLVAVLLSTCAISGTFAKYVTTASGTDTARVAKWGVVITANGNLFNKTYAFKKDNQIATETNSVISTTDDDDDDVVAPGTSGEIAKMTLAGTPEVAVKVTYEATTVKFENWTVKVDSVEKFYCPIAITVRSNTGTDTVLNGLDYTSASDFQDAIKDAVSAYTKSYDAGTDLSQKTADSLVISWEWLINGATGTAMNQSDEHDTFLGNAGTSIAGVNTHPATVKITIKTIVTQID